MRTSEFLEALLGKLPQECVFVSALGRTSEELYRLAAQRTLFTDTMGDVASLSIGLAIAARPVTVVGVDTDGSFLMNLSVLTALGSQLPALDNYLLTIVDNGQYESAGGMPSRTAILDWDRLFASVGLTALTVREPGDMPDVLPTGGTVIVAEVVNEHAAPEAMKTIDGVESSYAIEKLVARLKGVPARRPAVKS